MRDVNQSGGGTARKGDCLEAGNVPISRPKVTQQSDQGLRFEREDGGFG